MKPKLRARTIGEVNIFELSGVVADPWVGRIREEMGDHLREHAGEGLLINLREVEKADHPGAEAVLETARKPHKKALLGHNLSAYFVAEHIPSGEPIPLFEREKEAIDYFQKEFAQGTLPLAAEKRRFPRIKTALPAEFEIKEYGESFLFEVVVANLGEGGLYGQFLDSKTEELAQRTLDPFELKLLKINLWLPGNERVRAEGKVLRVEQVSPAVSGVALEFYEIEPEDKEKLAAFLKLNLEEEKK